MERGKSSPPHTNPNDLRCIKYYERDSGSIIRHESLISTDQLELEPSSKTHHIIRVNFLLDRSQGLYIIPIHSLEWRVEYSVVGIQRCSFNILSQLKRLIE